MIREQRVFRARGPAPGEEVSHAAARDGRAVLAMNPLLIVDSQAMPGPYLDRATGVLLAFNGESYNCLYFTA